MIALVTGGTRGIGAAVTARLRAEGYEVIATGRDMDVTDSGAVFHRLEGMHLDAVINCAAVNSYWQAIINTNLSGTFYVCAHALDRGVKHIINFAGGGVGGTKQADNRAYVTSKAAVVQYTEHLAKDYPGIQINCIAPGNVKTDMNPDAMEGPEDACNLVSWLLSPASCGITGKLLSAKWDNYREWTPDVIKALNASDKYTLRRIV